MTRHRLRVIWDSGKPKDEVAAVLPKLAATLGLTRDDLDVEWIESVLPNYRANYLLRFRTLCKAAKFLFNHLPDVYPRFETTDKQAPLRDIDALLTEYEEVLPKTQDVSRLRPILHSYNEKLRADLQSLFHLSPTTSEHLLSLAEEYSLVEDERPDLLTLSQIDLQSHGDVPELRWVLQRENPLCPLPEQVMTDLWLIKTGDDFTDLPIWYTAMEPLEKLLVLQLLDKVHEQADIPNVFRNISSRLRTFPSLANTRRHEFNTFDKDWQLQTSRTALASSMISSRDVKDFPPEVSDFHTYQNLAQVVLQGLQLKLEKQAETLHAGQVLAFDLDVLVQTLISPIWKAGTPDYHLWQVKEKIVAGFVARFQAEHPDGIGFSVPRQDGEIKVTVKPRITLYSTNHPLNLADKIIPTPRDDEACNAVLTRARRFIAEHSGHTKIAALEALATQYDGLLGVDSRISTLIASNKRELFLSSLEQLMFDHMDATIYGSCVSGKDRKALEIIHSDAMQMYYDTYGHWPTYQAADLERSNFVNMFAHLYVTRHHHESSSLNAPGAAGIKTPGMYLPKDICLRIETLLRASPGAEAYPVTPSFLKADDRVASTNEEKDIARNGEAKPKYEAKKLITKVMDYVFDATAPAVLEAKARLLAQSRGSQHNSVYMPPVVENKTLSCCLRLVGDISRAKYWNGKAVTVRNMLATALSIGGMFGSVLSKEPPAGIHKLRSCFGSMVEPPLSLLPTVYSEVAQRSLAKQYREGETDDFYNLVKGLLLLADKPREVAGIKADLTLFYSKIMRCEPPYLDEYAEDEEFHDAIAHHA